MQQVKGPTMKEFVDSKKRKVELKQLMKIN